MQKSLIRCMGEEDMPAQVNLLRKNNISFAEMRPISHTDPSESPAQKISNPILPVSRQTSESCTGPSPLQALAEDHQTIRAKNPKAQ